jgi:hypothetical protein
VGLRFDVIGDERGPPLGRNRARNGHRPFMVGIVCVEQG